MKDVGIIDGGIQKLQKQVIEEVANDFNTRYYSNLFTNSKKEKDGNYRTILKLKKSMDAALQNIFKWNP